MSTNHFHKLIDGTFTAAEAKTVLFSLVESKIRYHQMEMFSNHERFGRDVNHSEKRIQQLLELRNDLQIALDKAVEQNRNVLVNGTIELVLVDPTHA